MVKPLSARDFRAVRHVLEAKDYALVTKGRRSRARDRIDQETWHGIWDLPDSVAVETTNFYGPMLRDIHGLNGAWTGTFAPLAEGSCTSSPLWTVARDAFDAFEASLFCATVGYYRLAFMALRSVVENVSIGLQLELSADRAGFAEWTKGEKELKFGEAASLLPNHAAVRAVETALRRRTGNDLFRHKQSSPQPARRPGYARAHFDTLSRFAHARPEFTDASLWGGSNGPVFESRTLLMWGNAFVGTFALSLLMLRLGRPDLERLDNERDSSLRGLFYSAVGMLPARAPLRRPLLAVPRRLWGA
jgi:hypothetical protein